MATPGSSAKKAAAKKPSVRNKAAVAVKPSGQGRDVDASEGYLAGQPAGKRALLEKLRALVVKGVPDADVSIKWGVPIYAKNGKNVCALAAFKDHVAINFFAPAEVFIDPDGKLEGSGKGSRLLKVRGADDIDTANIMRWLKAAAAANA